MFTIPSVAPTYSIVPQQDVGETTLQLFASYDFVGHSCEIKTIYTVTCMSELLYRGSSNVKPHMFECLYEKVRKNYPMMQNSRQEWVLRIIQR